MVRRDHYGKEVLSRAAPDDWEDSGPERRVDYGARPFAYLDGMVGDRIVVEVESREAKQVRGAVLDLICHPAPKKLLVLLPAWNDPQRMKAQATTIVRRFLKGRSTFRVVCLKGKGGTRRHLDADVKRVRAALRELGWRGVYPRGT